jgi:hypothetical protein
MKPAVRHFGAVWSPLELIWKPPVLGLDHTFLEFDPKDEPRIVGRTYT